MCKFPLKGFKIGLTAKGKDNYKITSFSCNYVWSTDGDVWHCSDGHAFHAPGTRIVQDYIEIPCGKCLECRLAYSRQWADRCCFEAQYHENNYFITLTYDDDSLSYSQMYCPLSGEVIETPTLVLADLQKFFKRLRRRGFSFRYFACGEYGSETLRPHYHAIMFGLKLDDLEHYKTSKLGFDYFISPTLSEVWGKGFVVVAPFSWETAAYTARYCMKKANNNLSLFYDTYGIQPEFVVMSRKPGIGREYYDDYNLKIYSTDEVFITSNKGGQRHRPPRYFDKLFEEDMPEHFAFLKDQRRDLAEEHKRLKLESTSLDYVEMLNVENDNLESRLKKLHREL